MKICLISEYALTRNVYAKAFKAIEGIDEVFDFETLRECINFLERGKTDIIILDIGLNENEIFLLDKLRQKYPKIRFIILEKQEQILQTLALGATYALKNMLLDEFIGVMKTVNKGNLFIASDAVEIVTDAFQEKLDNIRFSRSCYLTEREKDILILITKGKSNSQIGQELCLSTFTVKNYVSKIIEKLGVKDRTQATAKAVRFGLVG